MPLLPSQLTSNTAHSSRTLGPVPGPGKPPIKDPGTAAAAAEVTWVSVCLTAPRRHRRERHWRLAASRRSFPRVAPAAPDHKEVRPEANDDERDAGREGHGHGARGRARDVAWVDAARAVGVIGGFRESAGGVHGECVVRDGSRGRGCDAWRGGLMAAPLGSRG